MEGAMREPGTGLPHFGELVLSHEVRGTQVPGELESLAGSELKGASQRRSGAGSEARPLSAREREVLGMLAEGLSGAAIAERLVLSPETVRTHVRNAMDKLGASTRSQAVALALELGQIGEGRSEPAAPRAPQPTAPAPASATPSATLTALLSGVAALADVDAATIYFAQEGGLALTLGAHASSAPTPTPAPAEELTLGEGSIGRVALERRARLVSVAQNEDRTGTSPMLVTPMVNGGRLTGILCLEVRPSRPISRRELLLLEAFGNRVAEILGGGGDLTAALRSALQRFRASWTGTLEA
jgi:DNA-binding CsgD family transcriptional regulator